MTAAVNLSIALIVRHFPGEGRLSGLVSFSREIAAALKKKTNIQIFSGDLTRCNEFDARQIVPKPFWMRVWSIVRHSRHTKVIILSGIHSPRWAIPQALGIRMLGITKEDCLFVQAVGLDSPWSKLEIKVLSSMAKVSALNPTDFEHLRKILGTAIQLTPGVSLGIESTMQRPLGTGILRIGFLGHLNEVKGADRLPEIFESLSPELIQPVIAGVGKFEGQIKDWASQSAHSVEVHGYLDNPAELLKTVDILVAPFRKSATVLGLSQVVIEAIAMGIPVVGTPVDAISGVVSHQVEGLIAESNSEIVHALQELIDSRQKIAEFSEAAIRKGSQFSIEGVANKMLNIISAKVEY